jgi:hypothetical protein
MFNRKSMKFLFAVVAAGLLTAATTYATTTTPFTRINYLTFSRPVSLPGVSLGAGAYVFEEGPGGVSRDIVLVRNRETGQPMFLGFTREVRRPQGMPMNVSVEFGEVAAGTPTPIMRWYPVGSENGHEFLYR